ncbi:MAG: RluA family pseudouridine synthase [Campylobacterales bacterium]|nr:RluA family pseudouridine synthase [Campylobacterales bacterium]
MEKAYKLLAIQEDISNNKAKELIDKGIVYVGDKKVKIARALLEDDTKFRIEMPRDIAIIYQDEFVVAVDKPAFIDSYDIEDAIEGAELLHRLDRETSGVLVLSRDASWAKKAIECFKRREVTKKYIAWVEGLVYEEEEIDAPIATHKKGGSAFSQVDIKNGKKALTKIKPIEIQGKKSKIEIEIDTGRTHQIRTHLSYIGHPIVGDERYGSKTKAKRVLLHSKYLKIFDYEFEANEPDDILRYK